MKKIHLLYAAFFLLFVLCAFSILKLNELQQIEIPQNNNSEALNQYSDSLILAYESQQELQNMAFPSNFEGPKISIAYLSHRNKIWDKEQLPKFSFTPQSINFDPDWESYGLPNLHIEVTQPKFINATHQSERYFDKLKSQFGFLSETHPVKTYSKTYKNADGKLIKENYNLYLTEFNITIGVKPMREAPMIKTTSEEKNEKRYPKYWYQDLEFSEGKLTSLNDLRSRARESKNHRYSQLECVFKISPNLPINYTNSTHQTDPEVAVGAIITKQIKTNFDLKSGYQQTHINPSAPGLNLDLFTEPTLNNRHNAAHITQRELITTDNSIYNKEVFFRIQSNNIGSWDKKGLFFGTEWDDQFTITCFMPILVKGKFEVLLNSELTPEYSPPKAYYNSVTFRDILPDWGLSNVGKYISYGFIVFIIVVAILFVPHIFTLINAIFKRLASKLNPIKDRKLK